MALVGTIAVGFAVPVSEPLTTACLAALAVSAVLGRTDLLGVLLGSSFVWLAPPVRAIPAGLLAALCVALLGCLSTYQRRPTTRTVQPLRRSPPVLAFLCLALGISTALAGAHAPGLTLDLELVALLTVLAGARPLFARYHPDDGFVAVMLAGAIGGSWLVWARVIEVIGQGGVGSDRRVSTDFGASNYLVAYTAVVFFLTVAAVIDRLLPIPYVVFAGFPFYSLVTQIGSRSAAVSTALFSVMVVIDGIRRHDYRRRRAVGAFFISAAVLIVLFSGRSLLTERLQNLDNTSGRSTLFSIAIDAVQLHPVLGLGSNGLVDAFQAEGIFGYYSHNFFLTFLARYGIPIGLLLSAALLPRFIRRTSTLEIALIGSAMLSLLEPAIDTLRLGFLYAIVLTVCDVRASRSRARWQGGATPHQAPTTPRLEALS